MTLLPRMHEVRRRVSRPLLDDPLGEVRRELQRKAFRARIQPGQSIAVTAGSRGIARIAEVLAIVVDEIRQAGGRPFLVPAMGSHGGATAQGQVEVLRGLGITEETVGAPILSAMEVEVVGSAEGEAIFLDRNAFHADGIVVVNRVKPHTDFKGAIESGLMKMLAIGLGKQKGAEMIHGHLRRGYHELLPAAARLILSRVNVVMGLALVEDANHRLAAIRALHPQEIEAGEMQLLDLAKSLIARLPFKELDVLVVEEMGKHISGVGMDTNVTGRFWIDGETDPLAPRINMLVVLDLAEESHGNAIGIGLADLTTRHLVEKIDPQQTYINCLTQGTSQTGKIPIWLPDDREVIATALRLCGPLGGRPPRLVRIKNTLEMDRFWISEALAEELRHHEDGFELEETSQELSFDEEGMLVR